MQCIVVQYSVVQCSTCSESSHIKLQSSTSAREDMLAVPFSLSFCSFWASVISVDRDCCFLGFVLHIHAVHVSEETNIFGEDICRWFISRD